MIAWPRTTPRIGGIARAATSSPIISSAVGISPRTRASSRSAAAPGTICRCSPALGEVDAIEIDETARKFASERLGKPVGAAPLPELSGVERGAYDLVAVLDVVEHVEDDVAALRRDRPMPQARRQDPDHRPRAPMDVERARYGQPP